MIHQPSIKGNNFPKQGQYAQKQHSLNPFTYKELQESQPIGIKIVSLHVEQNQQPKT